MYLLSYRDSVEFQKEMDLRLIKDYGYFRDAEPDGSNFFPDDLPFLNALRAIDRGYRARTTVFYGEGALGLISSSVVNDSRLRLNRSSYRSWILSPSAISSTE